MGGRWGEIGGNGGNREVWQVIKSGEGVMGRGL